MDRQELIGNIARKRSFLCVGLDSDPLKLPACVRADASSMAEAMLEFNKNIIDPIKMIFDKTVYQSTWEEIVSNEIFRQRDKSNNNDIGPELFTEQYLN